MQTTGGPQQHGIHPDRGEVLCQLVQANGSTNPADTHPQRTMHLVSRSQRATAHGTIQHLCLQRYRWGCGLLERLAAEQAASAAIMAAAAASPAMPWDLLASTPLLTSLVIHASQAAYLTAGGPAADTSAAVLGRLRRLRVTQIQVASELQHVMQLLGGATQLTELVQASAQRQQGQGVPSIELPTAATSGSATSAAAGPSTGLLPQELPALHKLSISGQLEGVLEALLAPAGAAGQLTSLHLIQGAVWQRDLALLAACRGLQELVLKGCRYGQQRWEAQSLVDGAGLAPLTALRTLVLQSCCLDEVPNEVFGLSRLRQLSLRDNRRAIISIPEAISGLQQLQLLDISNAFMPVLPAELGTWLPQLEALLIEGVMPLDPPPRSSSPTDDDAHNPWAGQWAACTAGLQRLTRLEARGSCIRNVDAIHRLVNLKQLALSGVDLYTPATQLTLLTALETLWLEFEGEAVWKSKQQQAEVLAAQVVVPAPMPRLRSLTLSVGGINSWESASQFSSQIRGSARMVLSGLPGVVGAQQLTYLSLQKCFEQDQWEALGQLGVLPRLQQLKLCGRVGTVGLATAWLQQQPQLTFLELGGCLLEAAHMQQLPAQLETLHLPWPNLTPTQPAALPQLVGLRKLRVTISSQLPLWLLSLQRLESLQVMCSAQAEGSWEVLQQLPLLWQFVMGRRARVPWEVLSQQVYHQLLLRAPHLCWKNRHHEDVPMNQWM